LNCCPFFPSRPVPAADPGDQPRPRTVLHALDRMSPTRHSDACLGPFTFPISWVFGQSYLGPPTPYLREPLIGSSHGGRLGCVACSGFFPWRTDAGYLPCLSFALDGVCHDSLFPYAGVRSPEGPAAFVPEAKLLVFSPTPPAEAMFARCFGILACLVREPP